MQIGKKKNSRMLKKAVQPYFAKASSGQAKARRSEAPGLSAEALTKAEAYSNVRRLSD